MELLLRFRQRLYRYILLSLVVVGLLSVLSCSEQFSWQRSPAEDIYIGLIASLTSEAAAIGQSTLTGAELAVQEVNQAGGLRVRDHVYRVVLRVEDDQDEVNEAVNAARKLIYHDNVVAIVGPQLSRNAIPVAKFVESAQVPMISPRSTNPETTAGKRYVFRATFIDPFQGQVMAQFAHQDLQAQTAAVLYDIASAYNRGIADVFKQVFEAEGGQVVAFESYTTGAKDFQQQLAVIRDYSPDVLFLPNYNYEIPLQVAQIRQLGITATLLGSDSWGALQRGDRSGLNGSFFSDQYAPDTSNPKAQAFIKLYRQTYNHEPDANTAATYDALHLLFQAMQNQGVDPESIRQGLAELGQFEGVTGTIDYQGTGDPVRSVVILQIKDGKAVFYKQVDP